MTPELFRVIVPSTTAGVRPVLLVGSGNYHRRVSIMYRRYTLTVGGVLVTPELFLGLKDSIQTGLGGQGIYIPPNMQFQIELDRQDRLLAIADANAAHSPENGIEVSVIIETLEANGSAAVNIRTSV